MTVQETILVVDGRSKIRIAPDDENGSMHKRIRITETSRYRLRIKYLARRETISDLRFVQETFRAGTLVNRVECTLPQYEQLADAQIFATPLQVAPYGARVGDEFQVESKILDSEQRELCSAKWAMIISLLDIRDQIKSELDGCSFMRQVAMNNVLDKVYLRSPNLTDRPEIPMATSSSQSLDYSMVMERILENFVRSGAKLCKGTWDMILEFDMDLTELDTDRRSQEIAYEVLYVVSQLDYDEYQRIAPNMGKSREVIDEEFDDLILTTIRDCMRLGENKVADNRLPVEDERKTKEFLSQPIVRYAISQCLDEVLREHDVDRRALDICPARIDAIISEMKIFSVENLGCLEGVMVRDGFIINSALFNDTLWRRRARLYGLAIHEFMHYVTRVVLNDFGFSSPDLGHRIVTKVIGFDPDWSKCSQFGALLFLRRVSSSCTGKLPLFNSFERRLLLRELSTPCVSLAGYWRSDYAPRPRVMIPYMYK